MNSNTTQEYLNGLVTELRKLPNETGWVEFKENNTSPEDIGEYLSALSNAAALQNKANGYVVWGINNDTHEVTGTSFKPAKTKKGNEDLEGWLTHLLRPQLHFHFYELTYEGFPVVILEIPRAHGSPTQFQGVEYVRVGSYLHACLRYVERDPMTNSSLRTRFGISEPNKSMASRVIADALKDGLIKAADPTQGRKYAKYLPHWA